MSRYMFHDLNWPPKKPLETTVFYRETPEDYRRRRYEEEKNRRLVKVFKKAIKYQANGRIALDGPSGSGKTMTALIFATTLAEGGTIALIDAERGSASKYADRYNFDVLELGSDPRDLTPFAPEKYITAIEAAAKEGYKVLIIDSLSHAWAGTGGLLEFVDNTAKKKARGGGDGNKFTAWGDATPIQNKLIDAMMAYPGHIIATMRTKTEYVIESINGKQVPKKVGTKAIQRDGVEYEFDIVADMDLENTLIVSKSRCPEVTGAVIAKPKGDFAEKILTWLKGAPEKPKVETSAAAAPTTQPGQLPNFTCTDCKKTVPDKTIVRTVEGAKTSFLFSVYSGLKVGRSLCEACYDKTKQTAAEAPATNGNGNGNGGNGKSHGPEILCCVPGCGVILTGKTIVIAGKTYSWPEVSVKKLGMPYCEAHFAAQKSILAVEEHKRKMAEEEAARKLAEAQKVNEEHLGNVDEIPDDLDLSDSQRDLVSALAEAGDFEA